jgi:hypothetical protein
MSVVKDVNHIPELMKNLKSLCQQTISVGWHKEDNEHLAMIAGVQEYGANIPVSDGLRKWMAASGFPLKKGTTILHVPQRAPLRKAFERTAEIGAILGEGVDIMLASGNVRKGQNHIGMKMVRLVQRTVNSNLGPRNHPFTKKNKNGDKTLIDSGKLVNGVAYKIK